MAILRNQGQFGCPTYNQAQKVIARFGGEANIARLIGVDRITAYRWNYRRPYGSDGLIPTIQIEKIKKVARLEGVLLRDSDWVPEKITYDETARQEHKKTFKKTSLAELLS